MEYEQIILDLLNRVIVLEKEVAQLKETNNTIESPPPISNIMASKPLKSERDKTRYLFQGVRYLKNRLVLAVVTEYVKEHPDIICCQLKKTFDKSLQGSIGVVEDYNIAVIRTDYKVRFFAEPDEIIHLVDGDMLVCSQWGILNIVNFINRARQLGYNIEAIKY